MLNLFFLSYCKSIRTAVDAKKTIIPLNNNNGIPFVRDNETHDYSGNYSNVVQQIDVVTCGKDVYLV